MSEAGQGARPGGTPLGRLAHGVALAGGSLSVATALLVVASVSLRAKPVGLGGIPGDFELVQMLTAIAVFCFLPLCQARRGHVIVDVFSRGWSLRARAIVDGIWDLVAALAMGLVAFQLAQGAMSVAGSGTRTMVLGLPVYPAVWLCSGLAALLALVALARGLSDVLGQGRT
jgi:TRAP-type C4-dicarboxylate transport system permease small subunit